MKALILAALFSIPAAADVAQEVERSRAVHDTLLRPLRKAWLGRKHLAQGSAAWSASRELFRERGGITEERWSPGAASVDRWLSEFSSIEDVSLRLLSLRARADGTADLSLAFDVRGREKSGAWRNDRGTARARARAEAGRWTLVELRAESGETLRASRRVFEDVTRKAGLAAVEPRPRTEAIRRGGYALAVADYDGDGWPDMYVGGSGPGRLFRNKKGRFEDVSKAAGLAGETMVKAAVIADLDNDGAADLALQRFSSAPDGKELVFYRNAGKGRFEAAPAKLELAARHDRAMSMAAADIDGDGRLDLYVGYPGVRDFTDSRMDADPALRRQAVLLNKGSWRFVESADAVPHALAEPDRPHSEFASDLNDDGRQDLVVVNDSGGPSRVYLNEGDGRFARAAESAVSLGASWGMMAVAGDFLGSGRQGIFMSSIDLSVGRLIGGLVNGAPEPLTAGNRLWRARGIGADFEEVTAAAGVGWAGEAPAGAEWLDYDGDGRLDLYVTNGLWSADPEKDLAHDFVLTVLDAAGPPDLEPNRMMRRLQKEGGSLAGYQRNRLFRNNGDGTFTEVGYLAGADRLEDGYVAAVFDVDRDGRVDLVLRNADPADLRRAFPAVVVLRNAGPSAPALAVEPVGKDGSPAFGARVFVRSGELRQMREVRAIQGAVQSEPAAFFGLAGAKEADEVEVRWPSGQRDVFRSVAAGRYVLREAGRLTAVSGAASTSGGR